MVAHLSMLFLPVIIVTNLMLFMKLHLEFVLSLVDTLIRASLDEDSLVFKFYIESQNTVTDLETLTRLWFGFLWNAASCLDTIPGGVSHHFHQANRTAAAADL